MKKKHQPGCPCCTTTTCGYIYQEGNTIEQNAAQYIDCNQVQFGKTLPAFTFIFGPGAAVLVGTDTFTCVNDNEGCEWKFTGTTTFTVDGVDTDYDTTITMNFVAQDSTHVKLTFDFEAGAAGNFQGDKDGLTGFLDPSFGNEIIDPSALSGAFTITARSSGDVDFSTASATFNAVAGNNLTDIWTVLSGHPSGVTSDGIAFYDRSYLLIDEAYNIVDPANFRFEMDYLIKTPGPDTLDSDTSGTLSLILNYEAGGGHSSYIEIELARSQNTESLTIYSVADGTRSVLSQKINNDLDFGPNLSSYEWNGENSLQVGLCRGWLLVVTGDTITNQVVHDGGDAWIYQPLWSAIALESVTGSKSLSSLRWGVGGSCSGTGSANGGYMVLGNITMKNTRLPKLLCDGFTWETLPGECQPLTIPGTAGLIFEPAPTLGVDIQNVGVNSHYPAVHPMGDGTISCDCNFYNGVHDLDCARTQFFSSKGAAAASQYAVWKYTGYSVPHDHCFPVEDDGSKDDNCPPTEDCPDLPDHSCTYCCCKKNCGEVDGDCPDGGPCWYPYFDLTVGQTAIGNLIGGGVNGNDCPTSVWGDDSVQLFGNYVAVNRYGVGSYPPYIAPEDLIAGEVSPYVTDDDKLARTQILGGYDSPDPTTGVYTDRTFSTSSPCSRDPSGTTESNSHEIADCFFLTTPDSPIKVQITGATGPHAGSINKTYSCAQSGHTFVSSGTISGETFTVKLDYEGGLTGGGLQQVVLSADFGSFCSFSAVVLTFDPSSLPAADCITNIQGTHSPDTRTNGTDNCDDAQFCVNATSLSQGPHDRGQNRSTMGIVSI